MLTQLPRRHIKKLAEYSPDRYDIWFVDEVLFQQQGSRCRMWIPPEVKQPVIMQEPGRKSAGYFGAVRLRDGKFIFSREENVFNADSTWGFLKKLRRVACAGKKKAVIGIDNARYHHAIMHKKWREKVSCNFILEYLPPYSPELNPIERVWKLTRRLRLHNRYFPKLEDVFLATESLFKTWQNGAEDLKRLCRI